MNDRVRKILLIVFLALFIIVVPIIIGYGAGWRINWRWLRLEQTSTLIISVFPDAATVNIEDVDRVTKPGWIKYLPPGTRRIVVTTPQGGRWEKTLELKPGLVTYAEHVMLFVPSLPKPYYPTRSINPTQALSKLNGMTESSTSSQKLTQPNGDLTLDWSQPFELHITKKDGTSKLLTRRSQLIRDVEWYPARSGQPAYPGWILVMDDQSVTAIELDNRDRRNATELAHMDHIDGMRLSTDGDRLYVAGTYLGQHDLYSIDLFQSSTND